MKEDRPADAVLEAGAVELLLTWYAESEGNVAATAASLAASEVIEGSAWDADVNLSNTGREQANASGTVLARVGVGLRPEAVVSSREARAQQTAEIAVQTAGSCWYTPMNGCGTASWAF